MTALFAPQVSIATTKRRRYFWAAFWSGPPTESPFRAPDAHSGGAHTEVEARAQAERAAGMPLIVVSPRWARAVQRTLLGQPPFPPPRKPKVGAAPHDEPHGSVGGARASAPRASVWSILGIARDADEATLKSAFRRRALDTHPDRGGSAEAFREVHAAYLEAKKRIARPRRAVPR